MVMEKKKRIGFKSLSFRSLKGPDKEPSKQGNQIGSDSTGGMLSGGLDVAPRTERCCMPLPPQALHTCSSLGQCILLHLLV